MRRGRRGYWAAWGSPAIAGGLPPGHSTPLRCATASGVSPSEHVSLPRPVGGMGLGGGAQTPPRNGLSFWSEGVVGQWGGGLAQGLGI